MPLRQRLERDVGEADADHGGDKQPRPLWIFALDAGSGRKRPMKNALAGPSEDGAAASDP